MTSSDPVPSAVEPRTPTPYKAIGAGALGAAAISVLALSATAGPTLHEPAPTSVILLSVGVVTGIVLGLWGLQQHRYGQRVKATSAAEEARYTTWMESEEIRLHAEEAQQERQRQRDEAVQIRLAQQDARQEAMAMRIDQLSSRVGWLIQQLAPERRSDNRPAPLPRQGPRPARKRKSPSSLPPADAPGIEPEAQWLEDVAEAFRLGRETKGDEPPLP